MVVGPEPTIPSGQRSETVRRANLSAIVRQLHLRGAQSRSELVARTGLTRTAIRALIGELVAGDLVVEEPGESDGTAGRPSPLVRPRPGAIVVLALEIAVDSLAAALVGVGGETIAKVRIPRPRGHFSIDEIVADLHELTGRLPIAAHREQIIGVGVAVAGVVRRTDGVVSRAPNLGWHDVPLGEKLGEALGLEVPVRVANEADLGAMAELRRGAARGADNLLLIWGEVGVGGGIIVDGVPLTGVSGYAGEVGHMPVNPDGRRCGCGSIGCWETEVGEGALLRHAGRAPDGGPDEVDEVLRLAAEGDVVALDALAHGGPLARHRAGRPREPAQPARDRPRWPVRTRPSLHRPGARRPARRHGAVRPPTGRARRAGGAGNRRPHHRRGRARPGAVRRRSSRLARSPGTARRGGRRLTPSHMRSTVRLDVEFRPRLAEGG